MKWIHYFAASKIPFSIYKLNKDDAILYEYKQRQSISMIILYGLVYIVKTFTNNETSSIAILRANNIFHKTSKLKKHNTYYYKIIAIKNTFIINFKWKDLKYKSNFLHKSLLFEIIQSYQQTIYQYEMMNNILMNKYIQNRIIQLILILSEQFGIINKEEIIIPFFISQKTIGIMIGSNRITVNRVLHQLNMNRLITYSYNKNLQIKNPLALSHFTLNKE